MGHRWCRACYERSIRRDIRIFMDYLDSRNSWAAKSRQIEYPALFRAPKSDSRRGKRCT